MKAGTGWWLLPTWQVPEVERHLRCLKNCVCMPCPCGLHDAAWMLMGRRPCGWCVTCTCYWHGADGEDAAHALALQ